MRLARSKRLSLPTVVVIVVVTALLMGGAIAFLLARVMAAAVTGPSALE